MWLVVPAALGAPVVLYGPGADVELLSAQLEKAEIALPELRPFSEILVQAPAFFGGQRLASCADADALPLFRTALRRGQDAVLYMEFERGVERLEEAEKHLYCLSVRAEPDWATDLYLYRGLALHALGRGAEAHDALARAHGASPRLVWNAGIGLAGKDAFEAARNEVYLRAPARLHVSPEATGALWIDGSSPTPHGEFYELTVGEHLIQFGADPVQSLRFKVASDVYELDLELPSLHGIGALDWVEDPQRQEELSRLLARLLPEKQSVVVATGGGLWTSEIGSTGWTDAWLPVEQRQKRRRRAAQAVTVGGGAALFTAGAIVAAASYASGTAAARGSETATSSEELAAFEASRKAAVRTEIGGFGLVGIGIVGIGAGAAMIISGRR